MHEYAFVACILPFPVAQLHTAVYASLERPLADRHAHAAGLQIEAGRAVLAAREHIVLVGWTEQPLGRRCAVMRQPGQHVELDVADGVGGGVPQGSQVERMIAPRHDNTGRDGHAIHGRRQRGQDGEGIMPAAAASDIRHGPGHTRSRWSENRTRGRAGAADRLRGAFAILVIDCNKSPQCMRCTREETALGDNAG